MDTFLVVVLTGLVGYKYNEHRKKGKDQKDLVETVENVAPSVMDGANDLDESDLNLGATINDLKTLQKNASLGMDNGPKGPNPKDSVPVTTSETVVETLPVTTPETVVETLPVTTPETVVETPTNSIIPSTLQDLFSAPVVPEVVNVPEVVKSPAILPPSSTQQERGSLINFRKTQPAPPVLKINPDGEEITGHITGSHPIAGRSASMVIPSIAETHRRRDPSNDTNEFAEQFFPQDTRSTGFSVVKKPWMRAVENSHNISRSETMNDFPKREDQDDVRKTGISSTIRKFGDLHTKVTVPRTSEKQFEYSVESIQTQNAGGGGLRGQRQMERHHKFLLNNEPALELPEGPRGNFAGGANKSVVSSQMNNNRVGLDIAYVGAPVAPSFKVGFPEKSFELEASNAEGYLIDKHTSAAGSKAPVEKGLSNVPPSFSVAHDNKIGAFDASMTLGFSKSSRPKAVSDVTTSTFKDPTIATPTVLGAAGGNISKANDKKTEVDPKSKGVLLALAASKVNFQAGSKKSGPSALISKSSHQETETRLAEEDTSARVRGSSLRNKSVLTSDPMSSNDNKSVINQKEFTSLNFSAPQDTSLPLHLRTKPTSSITASKDISLKTETLDTIDLVRGRGVDTSRAGDKLVNETTTEERKLGTILNNRMSSGKHLELLANPYKRPAATRIKQLEAI